MWVAVAILASFLAVAPAAAAPAPCGSDTRHARRHSSGSETITFRTFHVVMKTDKKVYRVGEVAKIHITVTRPAHEDPLGQGIPMDPPRSFPAEGVGVGVGLSIGRYFYIPAFAPDTDENGKTVAKVKLPPWTPEGKALADGYAEEVVQETPCLTIKEDGYRQEPNFFRVIKP